MEAYGEAGMNWMERKENFRTGDDGFDALSLIKQDRTSERLFISQQNVSECFFD